MALQNSVIHQIFRNSETTPVQVTLRETAGAAEGIELSLYEQLRQTFVRNTQKRVGQFDSEQFDNPFPKLMADLHEGKTDLVRLSQHLMNDLKHALDTYQVIFNGHVLFAMDSAMKQDTLGIYWFEHQQAEFINKDLQVEHVGYIDTKSLVAGVSINMSDYRDAPEEKYLTVFAQRGNKDLATSVEAFARFTTQVNTAKETEAFLEIVEQYARTLPEEEAQIRKNDIIDYCIEQNMAGEPVHIDALSMIIDEKEPEAFSAFVSDHQEKPKKTIHTHRPVLKRYGRYSGRDKDISLSFNANLVGEGIEFDLAQDALIIRHIPKGLKEQLVKAMKENSGE